MPRTDPIEPQPRARRNPGAADLCRTFLENEGWSQLFAIARGQEAQLWVKSAGFGGAKSKKVTVTPDFGTRLDALKLIASYGYGRPAELASSDDSGRTVTDLLLAALKSKGPDEEGPQ